MKKREKVEEMECQNKAQQLKRDTIEPIKIDFTVDEFLLSEVLAQHPETETAANCTAQSQWLRMALKSMLCTAVKIVKTEPFIVYGSTLDEFDCIVKDLERHGFQLSWLVTEKEKKRKAKVADLEAQIRELKKARIELLETMLKNEKREFQDQHS